MLKKVSIVLLGALVVSSAIIFLKINRLNHKVAELKGAINDISGVLETQAKNEVLVSLLKVYSAYDQNGPLRLERMGRQYDGGYVVPVLALNTADVLLGYGIADDSSFEEQFCEIYQKPAYGFDCGVNQVASKNKLFTFVPECIASDKFLYGNQKSSAKISSFTSQINKLNLSDKKIFIKMDIEGAEYEAFDDILTHHAKITGIVLEIHFGDQKTTDQAIKLLHSLFENFVLLHVHGNNCGSYFTTKNSIGSIPKVLELTYIHKSLVTNYHLSKNQSHPLEIDMPNNPNQKDCEFEVLVGSA
jgi:hypothetical protein